MKLQHTLDSLGVQLAFAEANAWDPSLTTINPTLEEIPVTTTNLKRTRARNKTLVFGIASSALYAVTFMYADAIMSITKQGKLFAVIPIAMVFLFSWVHGNFTANLWSALGIEASAKKPAKTPVVEAPVTRRSDTRPRATVQA